MKHDRAINYPMHRDRGERGITNDVCGCWGLFEQWYAYVPNDRSSTRRRKAIPVKRCTECGKLMKYDHRPGVVPRGYHTTTWMNWDGIGEEIKF